jgi:hypothetical protein
LYRHSKVTRSCSQDRALYFRTDAVAAVRATEVCILRLIERIIVKLYGKLQSLLSLDRAEKLF